MKHNEKTTSTKYHSREVLPKVGCRGPLDRTKSSTIVLTKCIFEQRQQGKKH